ncbi:MAG: glycosyltransferase [Candidatus Eisenbacteria bacterium]|uniref:Glycosyltransferase n=1 Tax=Eiseniibacteriota bacterium TaxID=2212470 RepID=A0A956NDE0_UNCEI|nr:glycosyltransferase [Candidatus Eisenbacteria bacterium]
MKDFEFDVTIAFVVYRTPDFLRRALDAVASVAPSVSYEVRIEDNDPLDDGSERVAEEWGARGVAPIHYRKNVKNLGLARALNQAIRDRKGRHVLNLNPDVEVGPGSIEALVDYLDRHPDCGIVAPRLHYADGTLQDSCRTFYSLPIFLLRRTFLGKLFPNSSVIREHLMLDWDHEDSRVVDWCIGGALLVRDGAIDDVGGMDERFFLYFEDVDWCYRMHQRGWTVVYHPESRMIHHYQRSSAGWKPSRGLWLHLASTVRFYEKWSFLLYWAKQRSGLFRQIAFFSSDLVAITLAFLLAYSARKWAADLLIKPLFSFELYLRFFVFSLVVALGTFLGLGHYRRRFPPTFLDNFLPVLRALSWTAVLMMASTFLIPTRTLSRIVVLLFLPLAAVFVTMGRTLLSRMVRSVRDRDVGLRRLGVLGSPSAVEDVVARFRSHGRFEMEPVPIPIPQEGEHPSVEVLLRRLANERVQEVLLFEEPGTQVAPLVAALHGAGTPVRLVPALAAVLPIRGELEMFFGIPAIRLGASSTERGADPGKRALDVVFGVLWGLLFAVPFLLFALGRALGRKQVLEHVRLRGRSGLLLSVYRADVGPEGGAWRALMRYYPSWLRVLSGDLSFVGIYPFPEEEWQLLDEGYRAAPPAALPGVLGPWLPKATDLGRQATWNQRYPHEWSGAGDMRIAWNALRGHSPFSGGRS